MALKLSENILVNISICSLFGLLFKCFLLVVLGVLNKEENIFSSLLSRTRAIMGRIGKSCKAKRTISDQTGLSIIYSCPTRWWSELCAVSRIIEIETRQPGLINHIVTSQKWKSTKYQLTLGADDMENLEFFQDMFKEFMTKSDTWGGENFSNICLVLPMLKDLYLHVDKFHRFSKMSPVATQIKEKMEHYLGFITDPEDQNYQPLYTVATFLSSTYYASLDEGEIRIALNYLVKEVSRMMILRLQPQEQEPPPKRKKLPGLRYIQAKNKVDINQNSCGDR